MRLATDRMLSLMHEVALSRQIAKIVSRSAGGRRVRTVRLEVGALRQVVPETLAYAWGFVSAGGSLAGSVLETVWVPAVIRCGFGHETDLGPELGFDCGTCGSLDTTIIAGEEFRVLDIEVE